MTCHDCSRVADVHLHGRPLCRTHARERWFDRVLVLGLIGLVITGALTIVYSLGRGAP